MQLLGGKGAVKDGDTVQLKSFEKGLGKYNLLGAFSTPAAYYYYSYGDNTKWVVKKVKKTKKLIELTVRLGEEKRTVVSGIAADFNEEDLIGKKVSLLTNLKPRKLKGIESQGMILLGENSKGNFVFVGPEDKNIVLGTPIK